jgi:hypothetical protein
MLRTRRPVRSIRLHSRSMAASEPGRALYPREEQLLGVVLNEPLTTRGGDLPDILPYWCRRGPESPTPAA